MSFTVALEGIRKTNNDLFVVTLPDETEILFRLPSIKQALQFSQVLALANDNCALQTIVYNYIFDEFVEGDFIKTIDLKAGVSESIAKTILYLSGVTEHFKDYTESLLSIYRSQTSNPISLMKRTICLVFQGYKMSDLEALNFQNLIQLYVDAEVILLERGIIEGPFEFVQQQQAVEPPVRVEDIISRDSKEYGDFENPIMRDPRRSEKAAQRAAEEELKYRKAQRHKRGG